MGIKKYIGRQLKGIAKRRAKARKFNIELGIRQFSKSDGFPSLGTRINYIITTQHNNFFATIGSKTRVTKPHKGLVAFGVGTVGGVGYSAYRGVKAIKSRFSKKKR